MLLRYKTKIVFIVICFSLIIFLAYWFFYPISFKFDNVNVDKMFMKIYKQGAVYDLKIDEMTKFINILNKSTFHHEFLGKHGPYEDKEFVSLTISGADIGEGPIVFTLVYTNPFSIEVNIDSKYYLINSGDEIKDYIDYILENSDFYQPNNEVLQL